MSFFMGSSAFSVASRGAVKRLKGVLEPMGFITTGGEFREGPPPAPTPPPPSRYDTFAQIDNDLTKNMGGGNNIFSSPPSPPTPPQPVEPTGMGRDNYNCDVFDMVGRTTNMWRDNQVLPNLNAQSYQHGNGTITIHDIDQATRLNDQHKQEHYQTHPDQSWFQPHEERRLVVDLVPNQQPAQFERAFSSGRDNVTGDAAHAQVFVTTVGSLSLSELEADARRYQIPNPADSIADVTSKRPSTVTRSIVARGTEGTIQYMVYRTDHDFQPR